MLSINLRVFSYINWKFQTAFLVNSLKINFMLVYLYQNFVYRVVTASNFDSWILLDLCLLLFSCWSWTSSLSLVSFLSLFPKLPWFFCVYFCIQFSYPSLQTLPYLTHKLTLCKSAKVHFMCWFLSIRLFWLGLVLHVES